MTKKAICPTCGTKLGRLHSPKLWRKCTACERNNPRSYLYCGWCASPLENTELRRKLTDVATPPGGWPSLATELVEVRFFMDRGKFADAFELLAILRQRFPLHPELEEFTEGTRSTVAVDTDVHRVVDGVLADSSKLDGSTLPRRAAATWNVPHAHSKVMPHATGSHTALDPTEFDEPTDRRRSGRGSQTQRGNSPNSVAPVVPVISPEARSLARPKKKKRKKDKASRSATQRYERAPVPVRTPAEITPAPAPAPGVVRHANGADDTVATTAPQEVADSALAPTAGTLYSEPATEEARTAAAHSDRLAAAEQEIVEESQRRRAEGQLLAAAKAADAEAVDKRSDLNAEAIQAADAEAVDKRSDSNAEAIQAADEARVAVEDALSEIADRPGAQTGRTHVGPAPTRPAGATGDTAVGHPPTDPDGVDNAQAELTPAVTGDTAVGEPPVARPAMAVTGDTVVGMPPSAEPDYEPPPGLTISVDALQPPTPFEAPARPRKGVRGRPPKKRSMKPRKRSGKMSPVDPANPEQQAERQEKVRRRAARFGQGIVGK